VDNSTQHVVPRVPFTVAKKVFDGTACLLETMTKGGDDVYFLSSVVVCASTIPCEKWYTKVNGDPLAGGVAGPAR